LSLSGRIQQPLIQRTSALLLLEGEEEARVQIVPGVVDLAASVVALANAVDLAHDDRRRRPRNPPGKRSALL